MSESAQLTSTPTTAQRPWDARLARRLVAPLKDTWVTPNHLTTVRLAVGCIAAAAFIPGTYVWSNLGALFLVLSNFLDHADGELARISGKSSRFGHFYDLASDALVTVLLFVAIGVGMKATGAAADSVHNISPAILGVVAGVAVSAIFLVRMQIESMAGKAGTRQTMLAGFETEDVLYLMPLVTVSNGVASFLAVAAVGAPLFCVWVLIDYRRALSRHRLNVDPVPGHACVSETLPDHTEADGLLVRRVSQMPLGALRSQFERQGAFVLVPGFAGEEIIARLIAAVDASKSLLNRNYIPGHKQGGSVSRHALDKLAPIIGELYRSPALIDWLGQLGADRLQPAPADDPHAYALYFYTNPGDHIGWHYDTSYYVGRRYTLLIGVIDDSSCRLDYELHTRESGVAVEPGTVRLAPGDLAFFDGDKLRHRITPLGQGEVRVSLTFEYVTDPNMHPWWRLVSNMKDAIAYFGFRQVFRRVPDRTTR